MVLQSWHHGSAVPLVAKSQQLLCCCLLLLAFRQLRYETGDHVGIHALNADDVVSEVAAALGLPLQTVFIMHTAGDGARYVWHHSRAKSTLVEATWTQ